MELEDSLPSANFNLDSSDEVSTTTIVASSLLSKIHQFNTSHFRSRNFIVYNVT